MALKDLRRMLDNISAFGRREKGSLDKLDAKVVAQDGRIDGQDTRMDDLEQRIEALEP
ncbi:MAG: hypothetical protein V3U85_10250 [Hyphomicrobium sp.]